MQIAGVRSANIDLTDLKAAWRLLDSCEPQVIFHFAAPTSVDWCEKHPDQANEEIVDVAANLANWCRTRQATLVYMSTDSVFEGLRGSYTEEDAPAPVNVYARCKLAAETAVRDTLPAHIIVRANIFGWNAQDKMSLAEWFLSSAKSCQTVIGFTDVIFTPLSVNSLAKFMINMVEEKITGTWHAACSRPISKYEFGSMLFERGGCDAAKLIPNLSVNAPFHCLRPLNTSLIATPLSKRLGLNMPTIESEIDKMFNFQETGRLRALKSSIME